MMLRDKVVYESTILDLAPICGVDDADVSRQQLKSIAMMQSSVSLDILYSIVDMRIIPLKCRLSMQSLSFY